MFWKIFSTKSKKQKFEMFVAQEIELFYNNEISKILNKIKTNLENFTEVKIDLNKLKYLHNSKVSNILPLKLFIKQKQEIISLEKINFDKVMQRSILMDRDELLSYQIIGNYRDSKLFKFICSLIDIQGCLHLAGTKLDDIELVSKYFIELTKEPVLDEKSATSFVWQKIIYNNKIKSKNKNIEKVQDLTNNILKYKTQELKNNLFALLNDNKDKIKIFFDEYNMFLELTKEYEELTRKAREILSIVPEEMQCYDYHRILEELQYETSFAGAVGRWHHFHKLDMAKQDIELNIKQKQEQQRRDFLAALDKIVKEQTRSNELKENIINESREQRTLIEEQQQIVNDLKSKL